MGAALIGVICAAVFVFPSHDIATPTYLDLPTRLGCMEVRLIQRPNKRIDKLMRPSIMRPNLVLLQ